MYERILLVSTCGTSFLTNGASTEDRLWLTKIANDVEVDDARLTPIVRARREGLRAADEPTRRKMSEPRRDCRRHFGLSHAAMAGSSSIA